VESARFGCLRRDRALLAATLAQDTGRWTVGAFPGFAQRAYREQHFDCLACRVAAQHRAGIDIMVDGREAQLNEMEARIRRSESAPVRR
jgi:hypothetical protein